jgi:hypothetical protein
MIETNVSTNFSFLAKHSVQLVRTAGLAERYLADDPNTCLIKLRQYAEILAGEPVPQDPNDEPASVLLERIRGESAEVVIPKAKRGRKPREMAKV